MRKEKLSLKTKERLKRQDAILKERLHQAYPKKKPIGPKDFPHALRSIFYEYEKGLQDLSESSDKPLFSDDNEFDE